MARGSLRRFTWLYRPTLPSARAQAIQVVHAAHAMAARGHRVTVTADRGEGDALGFYGLEPVDGLDLVRLPASRTLGSLRMRAAWATAPRGTIGFARSKKHALEWLRWGRGPLVLEVHEVDSAQAEERGEDPTALRRLEARVLAGAAAVVANAPGTLALLREVHPVLPPALVAPNGTSEARVRVPVGPGEGVGYAGSVRDAKGLAALADAAARLDLSVTLVTGDDATALVARSGGRLRVEGPLAYRDVPDRLAAFRVLVLPLARGLFGERLTSPLKLPDYLASGRPVVGADLPSLHALAAGAFEPYDPDDVGSLVAAIRRAHDDEAVRARLLGAARVPTWAERAAVIEAFLDDVL